MKDKDLLSILLDESFKSWVRNPTLEKSLYWEEKVETNPSLKPIVLQGAKIINSLLPEEVIFSQEEILQFYDQLNIELYNQ